MSKRNVTDILIILAVSLFVMARQLVSHGYFSANVNDTFAYAGWAGQFFDQLKEGTIYPRWMPNDFYGFGGPVFILYPPLAFYVTAFFHIFTDSIITAMNLTKLLALFLSGLGIYLFVKQLLAEKYALAAALFYLIMPFTVMQFYLLGAFASTVSFIWFPYILFFVNEHFRSGKYKYFIYASICYAGLICTHLINAYMFTFVLVIYIFALADFYGRKKLIFTIPAVTAVSSGLSAAYLLPLFFEKKYLNLESFVANNKFSNGDFRNFFLLPNMTHNLPSGHSWVIYYPTYVAVFIIFITLLTLALLHTFKGQQQVSGQRLVRYMNIVFICLSAAILFLLFQPSTFIWETVPYFKYIQFPARWLIMENFLCPILAAICLYNMSSRKRMFYILLMSLFFVILDFKYVNISNMFDDAEITGAKGETNATEHLPAGVDLYRIEDTLRQSTKAEIRSGTGEIDIVRWKPAERAMGVHAVTPLTVAVSTFDFPGWKAYLDGRPAGIAAEETTGAIVVGIPQGRHSIQLEFEDTPVRKCGKLISLLVLLLCLFLLIIPGRVMGMTSRRIES